MTSIRFEELSKNYGDNIVVDRLSLDVKEGEFLTLLGPSGCGKTTTLRCLAGLERPSSGRIVIGDREVVGPGRFVPPNERGLGMVFQSYALWPHMTVGENVAYPLKRAQVGRAEQRRQVAEALSTVGLGHLGRRPVTTLSGGQQQRVALARAIVAEPPIVLYDEPLSNLDARLRSTMRLELQLLSRRLGTTSIYVTHDQIEALTLSDRIVVLDQGRIQQMGTPEEIYSFPANRFVADFLGFENLLDGRVAEIRGGIPHIAFGAAGTIPVPGAGPFRVGDSVCVAVRASAVTLATVADDAPALGARVVTRTFLGDQTELVADADGRQVNVRLPSTSRAAQTASAGDLVRLSLVGERFSVFPTDGAPAEPRTPAELGTTR